MSLINRKSKPEVYKKVILIFTALIIPVYLVNLWINAMGLEFIRQKYTESNTYNLRFYANQLNDQMYFIRNLQLQLLNDPDLQKLSFMADILEPYEQLKLVNSISERMVTIQNSSDYLLNVGVYIKSFQKTISTKSGYSALPNEEEKLILSVMDERPKRSLYFISGRLFFMEFSNNSSIASYLELSVPQLKQALNQLVQYKSSGVILTDEQFGQHLTNLYDENIFYAIRESMQQRQVPLSFDSYVMPLKGESYLISLQRIPSLGSTLYTYSNQNEITDTLQKYNKWFIILPIFSIIVILIFSFSVNRMIHKPLHKLIRAFKLMETDHPRLSVGRDEMGEFDYLYHGLDRIVETLNKSNYENYEYQLALQNSELKQLQSQINPHFLYNSFYNIYRLSKSGDVEHVSLLTQKLASYYQFITRSGKDEVPLDKEYRHAKDYCDIQGIRFGNRIQVEMPELPEECKPLLVPRLIIQPIIENAFEHAFENSAKKGHVVTSVYWEHGLLSFRFEDDGQGMSDEQMVELQMKLDHLSLTTEKTGIINVSRRIRLKYGETSGVFVTRSKHGGMCVELKMKLVTEVDKYV